MWLKIAFFNHSAQEIRFLILSVEVLNLIQREILIALEPIEILVPNSVRLESLCPAPLSSVLSALFSSKLQATGTGSLSRLMSRVVCDRFHLTVFKQTGLNKNLHKRDRWKRIIMSLSVTAYIHTKWWWVLLLPVGHLCWSYHWWSSCRHTRTFQKSG